MKTKNKLKILITTVAGLALAAMAVTTDAAPISITNEPGHLGFGTGGTNINGGGARSTHTISNFSLNGGNAVVLLFAAEGNSGDNGASLSATYGGQAMTVVQTVGTGGNTDRFQGSIAYLIDPVASTGDIVANWAVSCESIIEPIALSNVAAVVGSASTDNGNSLSLNHTTTQDGGFVVGAGLNNSYQGGPGSAPTVSGSNLDTFLFRDNVSGNFAASFVYGQVDTAGTYTDTIGGSKTIESAALVAFEAVPSRPKIVSKAPPAVDAAVGANLVASFNETVKAGASGTINLHKSDDDTLVESFDVTTSAVVFSGADITVDPTLDLDPATSYYVFIDAGAILAALDDAPFGGIANPTKWSFETVKPPSIASLSPENGEATLLIPTSLVANFSETVMAGTGNIELRKVGGDIFVESFDVTTGVIFSGSQITMNPVTALEAGVEYWVKIPDSAILDQASQAFLGFLDPSGWSFTTDGTAPGIATLTPGNGDTGVEVGTNLVATFDEPVQAGTSGSITLYKTDGDILVQSFDVTTDVVFSGSQITMYPSIDLDLSTQYYVVIDANAVEDISGNGFAGLSGNSDWSFTSAAFKVVNSGSSVDGTIDATVGDKTITIDAGADAQFLIVATNTEFGAGTIGGWSATYDGNPMTLATGNGSQSMIFYLDLAQTAYAGGGADLTFAWDYTAGGDLGVGWVSIKADLEIGESIGLHSTAIGVGSVNLETSADATFNFVNFNSNQGSGAVAAPLTVIWGPQNFGSNGGAAGYENSAVADTHYYSWAATSARRIDAAAFSVTNGTEPAPVTSFEISAISSPQVAGTPITGITITAKTNANTTATGFAGTVDFGGTGGFSGTSANFIGGVLTGVSVTPTVAGSNLTLTVVDGSGHPGSTTIATIQSGNAYADWSGGAPFNGDSNGDGVQDGLAFLLGAETIGTNAIGLLPTVVEKNNGDLELTFTMLDSASRGDATLALQWSSDLGITDPWSGNQALVPDVTPDPQVAPVNFQVSGSGTLTVVATIAASEAVDGKLFGRLSGWIPPAAETHR